MKKLTFENLSNIQDPTSAHTKVYDDDGVALELGEEQQLGAGAGGGVYEIANAPQFCVKLFNPVDMADAAARDKIIQRVEAMVQMAGRFARDPRLAWPLGPIRDEKKNPIGYAMRRVPDGYKPFRSLFGGAAAVARRFPEWGRRELAVVAKNFLETVHFLETQGVQVADANPCNFVAGPDGRVVFLDTDSFSFRGPDGTMHCSEMHFPDCAAPEILSNPALANAPRTPEQGRFSAAVLAFQLLMLGQHPYTFEGETLDGATVGTPEENIRRGYCPLGKRAGCHQSPQWYALWSWFPDTLQYAFIRTFRDGHANPAARTPLDVLALEVDKFIFECGRMPERNALAPAGPKPRRDPSAAFAGPPGGGFRGHGKPFVPRHAGWQSQGRPAYANGPYGGPGFPQRGSARRMPFPSSGNRP